VDVNTDKKVEFNMEQEGRPNLNLMFYDFNNCTGQRTRETSGDRVPTRDLRSRERRPGS